MSQEILKSQVNFPLCLAPMVGLTHVALRISVRRFMPANAKTIWPTEMLNSKKIPKENLETTPETMRSIDETELVPQLLGNDDVCIKESILKLKQWGAEAIDINMGCPVQKALKHNYGVSLMGDAAYAAQVVKYAVEASDLPVSVKLRAGLQNDFDFLTRFVKGLEKAGASWITLHPRTAEQKRRGFADWSQIQKLKQEIQIPIIGNGDIQTADDVLRMLEETGCDMVMSGRALAARPWMLWQLGSKLGFVNPEGFSGSPPQNPSEEGQAYGEHVLFFLNQCRSYFRSDLAVRKFRFFVRQTSVWLQFGHHLHALTTRFDNLDDIQKAIEDFFTNEQLMYARTDLRE